MRTALIVLLVASLARGETTDLSALERNKGDFPAARVERNRAEITSAPWAFLRTANRHENVRVTLAATVREPAKLFAFFGSSWSVWPDPAFADQGYEVGVLLRAGAKAGYRVQLSHRYQDVALVRYPDGGFVRVARCAVKKDHAHRLDVSVSGNEVVVKVDGQEKVRYLDPLPTLPAGVVGVGTSSGAKVVLENLALTDLPTAERKDVPPHKPNLSSRAWLGGRPWLFDGDEPVLLLPVPDANFINNVKLRPGHRPQLSWNSHWDIANQGAFPDGANVNSPVKVAGGGKTIQASWTAKQTKGRFTTRTTMTAGFDAKRQTYTYDVDSELEVVETFHFRYGYDFEHHTPLDPFRWQYLVLRKKGGALFHRPVYPIDPGPQYDLETNNGLRVWYGRHGEAMTVAPAVEYQIDAGKRRLNTAVCAAFYDTGVGFEAETAKPGTKVRVRYRYTGYPAAEAEALFKESTIYPSHTLDPDHHYLFADDWPRIRFDKFVPMSETWIYGRRPFMTGHNRRPTYELAKTPGVGSGFAMRLGPGAFGAAPLAAPPDLAPGRYAVVARVKSDNAHGEGGRIELTVTPKGGKESKSVHYLGTGSFDWKTAGFAFDVPAKGAALTLGLGNAGTGDVLFGEVAVRRLEEGKPLPAGVSERPNATPPKRGPAPEGAIADYRMEEGKGLHVLNHADGPFGLLELANVGWTRDDGRPALVFRDDPERRASYPRGGALHLSYLAHPAYRGRDRLPVALTGHHGGGMPLKAFTLAAWIKPAGRMGKADHGGKGDVIGLGARRVILRLVGDRAPYRLEAALNVNDRFETKAVVAADRWQHVALTGEPAGGKWKVRLYVDGKPLAEGTTVKMDAPATIPPSLLLGAEIFYLHDAYYRGLIGRTLVFTRALSADEVARLVRP